MTDSIIEQRRTASVPASASATASATDSIVEQRRTATATAPASATVTERVETVAHLESECDGLKYDALSAAFDSHPPAQAVVLRELVLTLDAAMDAVEDVGDHLLFLNSAEV